MQDSRKLEFSQLLTPRNRGLLLDVIVFVINLLLMTILTRLFTQFVRQADENRLTQALMLLYCLGLAFLQPIGALLKRRRTHQRQPDLDLPAPTLLFHPIFYFLSKLLFLIAASAKVVDIVFGQAETGGSANYFGQPPWLFTVLFLGVPALAIINTAIVYFYFWQPKHRPLTQWLESPQAEALGDACLFINMIGYQVFWGLLMSDLTKDYSGIGERLFTFAFVALLIYFPPRLFYLAEDGHRPVTWLTMLLANTPVLLRILFSKS